MPDTKNKFIYVNGDSFAQGTGSYDHTFVDNYDDYKDTYKLAVQPPPLEYFRHRRACMRKKGITIDQVVEIEKERSWPTYLGEILGIEVINSSEGGSSLESILLRTMLELTHLAKQDRIPEAVIIHLTGLDRITLIQSSYTTTRHDLGYRKYSWINSEILSFHETDLNKAYLERQNDDDLFIHYLLRMNMLILIIQQITGKTPIFTQTTDQLIIKSDRVLRARPIFKSLVESSRIFETTKELTFNTYPVDQLACGHYGEKTTRAFASGIASYLREKYDFA